MKLRKIEPHISRRDFVQAAGITVWGTAVTPLAARSSEVLRPNVVLILPDQHRWDALGCNGNADAITPNIDRLAREGVNFSSSYAAQPVCSPNRSSAITGQFPHKTGVIDNGIPLIDHSTSFPRLLQQAGYKTAYFGKWHLGPIDKDGRLVPPAYFDMWKAYHAGASFWLNKPKDFGRVSYNSPDEVPDFRGEAPGTYRTDLETDQAIDFVQANRNDPFCVILGFCPPHRPWTAPVENLQRFKGRVKYPTYHAMVNRIDENVGRLVSAIDALALRENTIFIYTSDHGHNFEFRWNQHPKRLCYDTAAKVPLLFHWPGRFRRGTRRELISSVDIGPTILDLCGIEPPQGSHGRSAKGLLQGEALGWREYAIIENRPLKAAEEGMFERCIVTDRWKLILNTSREPELYDRANDPDEVRNVYADPSVRSVKKELMDRLEDWAWQSGDGPAIRWLIQRWRRKV